jgi:D-alanyl-D-alanine carboxypeptidase
VVLTNCMDLENWAFGLVRDLLGWVAAESRGDTLPPMPDPPDPTRVANAADYQGVLRTGSGERLEVVARGEGLVLVIDGLPVPLARRWDDDFLVEHAEFERFLMGFERDEEGAVVAAHHGDRRWHRDPPAPDAEIGDVAHLEPFVGHYRSHNPWMTNFRVVLREDRLMFVHPTGWEEPLAEVGEARFRIGSDERSPERLAFDAVVAGRALRADRSGCPYYRTFTT